jgi:hypothetical protein
MRRRTALSTFLALSLTGLCACPTMAHQPAVQKADSQPQPQEDDQSWLRGPMLSFDFQGGTVREFIAALRKVAQKPVNVAVASSAAEVRIPPISMQSVSLQDALEAVQIVAELPANQSVIVTNLSTPKMGSPGPWGPMTTTAAFAIRLEDPKQRQQQAVQTAQQTASTTTVISIGDLISRPAGFEAQTVLAAVEAALQIGAERQGDQPELKFHHDSSMLIVRGDGNTVRLAHEVLGQLESDLKRRRGSFEYLREQAIEREAAVRTAEINLRTAQSRMEYRHNQAEQARAMLDKGGVPQQDVARIEMELAEARADVARAEVALDVAVKRAQITAAEPSPRGDAPTPDTLKPAPNRR